MIIPNDKFKKFYGDLEKANFDNIGLAIAEAIPNIADIHLDVFETEDEKHTYIVVEFICGAISVRNARGNSITANIEELSKMLNGGYYDEVEYYKNLKEKEIKENE